MTKFLIIFVESEETIVVDAEDVYDYLDSQSCSYNVRNLFL